MQHERPGYPVRMAYSDEYNRELCRYSESIRCRALDGEWAPRLIADAQLLYKQAWMAELRRSRSG
jgi:hypothetical protein